MHSFMTNTTAAVHLAKVVSAAATGCMHFSSSFTIAALTFDPDVLAARIIKVEKAASVPIRIGSMVKANHHVERIDFVLE